MSKIGASVKVAVITPDKHFAHSVNGVKPQDRHDPAALSVVLQILKDIKPDIYVDLGDLVHLAYITHWNAAKDMIGRTKSEDGGFVEMCLMEDHKLVNRWLDHVQSACRKDTQYFQLEGNHEEILRNSSYMHKFDGLDKTQFNAIKSWDLEQRKMKYIPYQKYSSKPNYLQIGKLRILHGQYVATNHLTRHWMSHQCSLIYGHLHTIESKSFPTSENHQSVQTIGCLCTPQASYHRGRNNAWGQAISVVYLFPNGQFRDVLVRIINGVAVFNGKVYRSKHERWME